MIFLPLFCQKIRQLDSIVRTLFIVLLWSLSSSSVSGAYPYTTGKQNSSRVFGKITDAKTKKSLDYVAVSVLAADKDSLLTGMLSESNGDFSFENLPYGDYRVKASYEGYGIVIRKVALTPSNPEQDMGNISMEESAHKMSEVTVVAEKAASNLSVDKKVFNIDKDISARGGNALDVMQNLPGVAVDADGGITLRNNIPLIYVDGKPTTLTLDQIPSDQIDRVEIITNPSAKYEAAASGGIVNVILKRSTKPGYDGMVTALIGTNMQYNGTAMINVHRKKIGGSLSFNASGNTNPTLGYDNRTNLNATNNTPKSYFNQNTQKVNMRRFETIHAGLDFFISNRNKLSIAENIVIGKFSNTIGADITSLDSSKTETSYGRNYNYEGVTRNNYTTTIDFNHTYPHPGKEYNITLQYDRQTSVTSFFDSTTTYDPATGNLLAGADGIFKQTIPSGIESHMATAQWDFSHPLRDSIKLEYGLRAYYKRTNSFANAYTYLPGFSSYVPEASLTTDFLTNEMIDAAYFSISQQIKKFAYQIGLRYEEDYFRGKLINQNQAFSYQYPSSPDKFYESFFPSFYLSQRVNDHHLFQLNATRKTNRPSPGQINPNLEVMDQKDYTKGNAGLQPEFINQGEVNYSLTYAAVDWLSSAYAKYTEHPITGITSDSFDILLATYTNGKGRFNYGWENTIKVQPVKNLNVSLDVNLFYTKIQAYLPEGNQTVLLTNSGVSWTAKAMISYKFPLGFAAQINGSYEAPKPVPQGTTNPVYFFDLSASKEFGPFTINFGISDVLNSNAHGYNYEVPNEYTQSVSKRRQTRFAKLSFVYKFGKDDKNTKPKRGKKDKDKDNPEEGE
jgi:outer membrane receptor for ferrienterochelin and colicin